MKVKRPTSPTLMPYYVSPIGFSESQEAYKPYPNALLCIRYISEVGMMIVGDCNTEAGEMKEGDNLKTTDNKDGDHEVRYRGSGSEHHKAGLTLSQTLTCVFNWTGLSLSQVQSDLAISRIAYHTKYKRAFSLLKG